MRASVERDKEKVLCKFDCILHKDLIYSIRRNESRSVWTLDSHVSNSLDAFSHTHTHTHESDLSQSTNFGLENVLNVKSLWILSALWQYDDAWRYAKPFLLNCCLRLKNEHKPWCIAIKTANNPNIGLRFRIVSFSMKSKIQDLFVQSE